MQKHYSRTWLSTVLLVAAIPFFSTYCNKSVEDPKEEPKETLSGNVKSGKQEPAHCITLTHPCDDPACRPYYGCEEEDPVVYYAGVSITYEQAYGRLRFNSEADLQTVLDQLDAAYEAHNANYENLYPSLTPEQMDNMDVTTGFDEFATYRAFENLFPGYTSKRKELENMEESWLAANMTGSNPDNYDMTFDNSENAVFGAGYQLTVGSTVYTMNTELQPATTGASPMLIGCISNKRKTKDITSPDNTRQFKLKVALNSIWIRSSAKGKVVSYVKSGNRWKRSRAHIAAGNGGTIYDNNCSNTWNFTGRNPVNGYKKRKEMKEVRRGYATWWKTMPGQVIATFDALNIATGTLAIN